MTTRLGRDPYTEVITFVTLDQLKAPILTDEEKAFVQQLIDLPFDSILDSSVVEKQCWNIGQQIYDKFKNENPRNIFAGKEAVQKISDAVPFNCQEGLERRKRIERAWDGIGDNIWSWTR